MVQIALLTPVANCLWIALRHCVGSMEATFGGIREPSRPTANEIIEAVRVKPSKGPRHLERAHNRRNCFGCLRPWLERKRIPGRLSGRQGRNHEGRLKPCILSLLLSVAEPQRMTPPLVSILI